MIDSLHEQVLDGGDAERPAAHVSAKELWRLRDARDDEPLFDAPTFEGLLEQLGRDIHALYEAERNAVAGLGAAIRS